MARRLRIFISSTMKDLANERAEVCDRLRSYNFEPVNAEELLPDGTDSWERILSEIEDCDLFVLILGESYGWIPAHGPMSSLKKSVTELEFEAARRLGCPVLVFRKRALESGSSNEDARRRDAFHKKVEDWDGGLFRADFDLARDLAEKVGHAVIEVLLKDFRSVHQRSVRASITPMPSTGPTPMWLPPRLLDSVRDSTAVLMLGAGASLQAGLPSATAFLDAMVEQIREADPSYMPSSSGTPFNAVATDFFSLLGEAELQKTAVGLIDPPYVTGPTDAHRIAVRLFDTILTTNYDTLLEQAMDPEITRVIGGEPTASDLASASRIFKLHGSISEPATLILTETELTNIEDVRPAIWREAQNLLKSRPLLSVGSSLRDPSLVRLLEACQPRLSGWAVLPEFGKADRLRLERWGLEAVQGDADSLMQILAEALL